MTDTATTRLLALAATASVFESRELQSQRAVLYEEAVRRARPGGPVRPLVVRTGVPYRALGRGQVRGARRGQRKPRSGGTTTSDEPAHFDALHADMMPMPRGAELFAKDLFGGADLTHRISVRVVTEYACIRCSCTSC